MTPAISAFVKQGLRSIGHYRRALSNATLPGVAVLCYHGVLDDRVAEGAIPFQYLHIPASTFDSHCQVIRDCCDPISLDDWRTALDGGAPLPKRPVLITFDDGYRSVLTKGAPILRKYGLPAAVFVCTGPMETRRALWFDAVGQRDGEAAVEVLKSRDYDTWTHAADDAAPLDECDPRALLTREELATLSRIDGIEVGGHTVNHPILARAPRDAQRGEIEQNLRTIQQLTGKRARAFAYPNGRPAVDYDAVTIDILRDAGVDFAFTTQPSFARAGEPPLERSRFFLLAGTSGAELAHRLVYTWPR